MAKMAVLKSLNPYVVIAYVSTLLLIGYEQDRKYINTRKRALAPK